MECHFRSNNVKILCISNHKVALIGIWMMESLFSGNFSEIKGILGREDFCTDYRLTTIPQIIDPNTHFSFPVESIKTRMKCRFFSARKHGLVDAAVRLDSSDKTAVIALPGGVGTLDEVFEILALIQLERIGSAFPVPFLLMNYDSFYSKLLEFLDVCEEWGTVAKGEVSSLWKVCDDNSQALAYLEEFYDLSNEKSRHDDRSQSLHRTVS